MPGLCPGPVPASCASNYIKCKERVCVKRRATSFFLSFLFSSILFFSFFLGGGTDSAIRNAACDHGTGFHLQLTSKVFLAL